MKSQLTEQIFGGSSGGQYNKKELLYLLIFIKPVLMPIFPYRYLTDITELVVSERQKNNHNNTQQ